MTKEPLFSLPDPSTATVKGPDVIDSSRGLILSLVLDAEDLTRSIEVRFDKPRAFRKRAETYCTSWHIKEAYDTVCEVHQSDWVAELRGDASPEWRDRWVMRHFMIYLDGFGCLEVVGESATLELLN